MRQVATVQRDLTIRTESSTTRQDPMGRAKTQWSATSRDINKESRLKDEDNDIPGYNT